MIQMKKHLTLFFVLVLGSAQAQNRFGFESATKLPAVVNSEFEESTPVFDPVHDRLFFTRSMFPENVGGMEAGQDLWYTDKTRSGWTTPTNDIPPLNNMLNNAVIGLSEDGQELYLLGTYEPKISLQKGFSRSLTQGENWSRPVKFDVPGLSIKGDFYGGWIDKTGKILLISMDGKESKGQEDLYVSLLENGKWTKPQWLGDSINSAGYEIAPCLMDDMTTLLFASSGHPGLGDCDIFYAYRKDSTWTNWTAAKNMGAPINSPAFDAFAFPVDEEMYFSSNRNDTFSNIYVAVNQLYFIEADTVRLAFQSYDTRLSDVKVEVFSEEGTLLGRYESKNSEILKIPGLQQKKDYVLLASHDKVDLSLFTPYLLNNVGAAIEELKLHEDGSLHLTPFSKEAIAKQKTLAPPAYVKGMQGILELDRIPVRNVLLALVNNEGKTVQYTKTDEAGRFVFAETSDSLSLKVKMLSELEYLKTQGVVYFTDADGNKLFKATSAGAAGVYEYQKLEAREIAQLKMLASMDEGELEAARGVFKYKNLPKDGVTLYLVDENDNIIEEVVTDESGQFKFTKLRPDQSFRIRVADEQDTDLDANGMVLFLDEKGNEMDVLTQSPTSAGFTYQPLDPEMLNGLKLMQEEDRGPALQNFVFSVGLFKYQNLPRQGITLSLLDENDNVIETVTTDENGHFVFSMLRPDLVYSIKVTGEGMESLDQSQLYFVSTDGQVITAELRENQRYAFKKLEADYFFNISQVNEKQTELTIVESFKDVVGVFKYQNLPKEGVKLYLLDENDKIVDTVYTDAEGRFVFSKLARESNFFVRLAEEDASLLDEASLTIHDEKNQELVQEEMTEQGFSFKTLPREKDGSLASLDDKGDTELNTGKYAVVEEKAAAEAENPEETRVSEAADTVEAPIEEPSPDTIHRRETAPVAAHQPAEPEEKNDLRLSAIYFGFNSIRLSDRDRYRLNQNVVRKTRDTGQPLLIVGYSCDIGTVEQNTAVARLRAEQVKRYLENMGLEADKMEIHAIGDSLKGVEHPTADQRNQFRKVEIYHLTP